MCYNHYCNCIYMSVIELYKQIEIKKYKYCHLACFTSIHSGDKLTGCYNCVVVTT